jgi:CubicO group peptidase (beta-lactamase class C family)
MENRVRQLIPDTLRTASAATLLMVAAAICCGAVHAQSAAEPVWPTKQWQTSTPEEQGMDSAALAKLIAFGTTRSLDSLLIVRHGRIVLDAYYAPFAADIPHVINSATKAIVDTLTAIAHQVGSLDSYDHPMVDFFKDRSIANLDDRKKAITVQNLLNMTSGLEWDEGFEGGKEQSLADWGHSPDGVQFILDRPMSSAPGDRFYYNSGNPHLVSAILTKLTGKSASDYANANLFGPLGITGSYWGHDGQGISTGGGGLVLLPRDMAKIGYLYLHNGAWENRQLLPREWVDRVSHATINMNASFTPNLRYSNFFWAFPEKNVYMAVGYHCQLLMVFPAQDMVAVTTARDFCPFDKMTNMISGAVKSDTALPADPAAAKLLADSIRDISADRPAEGAAAPELAASISGKVYTFADSLLRIKSLSLTLTDPKPHYDLEFYSQDDKPHKVSGPIGLDGKYAMSKPAAFGVTAVGGTWSDGHTFVIDLQNLGAGEERKWTLSFEGDRLSIHGKDREGKDISANGEIAASH